ncbi:nucleotidyltransferase domain-containing protein [Streptomyces sp. NPDC054932]
MAEVFKQANFPWWIAGGRAIELFVGHELRTHGDLDVLVLRRDQTRAQECLPGWDLHVADPPGTGKLRAWGFGEMLEEPLHDIWCRRTPDSPWSVQLMLDDAVGDEWVSRRDPRVRMPITRLSRVAADGTPYLTPEMQLFYKAKNNQRERRDGLRRGPPVAGPGPEGLAAGRPQGDRTRASLATETAIGHLHRFSASFSNCRLVQARLPSRSSRLIGSRSPSCTLP